MSVEMLGGVAFDRIDDTGVFIVIDGPTRLIAADTVIVCAGQFSERDGPLRFLDLLACLFFNVGSPLEDRDGRLHKRKILCPYADLFVASRATG